MTEAPFVLVTTEHKGVFAGRLVEYNEASRVIRLEQAQMCVYWTASIGGVLGLAATGPDKGCKISPPVPVLTLHAVTAVADCTPEAVTAWQARPWS